MTLRTPRRRISPRTKRRCRAIKDFLRRIAGSTSQPDIKINSSIALNVTNFKHQTVGLEQQLHEGSKHVICAECTSTSDTRSCYTRTYSKSVAAAKASRTSTARVDCKSVASEKTETSAEKNPRESKTKLLFKTFNDRKSDESELLEKSEFDVNDVNYVDSKRTDRESPKSHKRTRKSKRKHHANIMMEDYLPYFEKHKSKSAYEQFSSAHSARSYHSLIEPRRQDSGGDFVRHRKRHTSRHDRRRAYDRGEISRDIPEVETRDVSPRRSRHEDKYLKRRKEKHVPDLDDDFINNIIRRQYKPVKMFGRRESDLSQFSAPVCRDQEFSIPENIIEGAELCSCCYAGRRHTSRYTPYNELSDMRSICDTRLYSSNRNPRPKTYRRPANHYNYNDSSLYDVVPVKEKSSPKSRRKFIEDMMCYANYKEVPPSPRTQRPRLNLKAQHYNEMECKGNHYRSRRHSPNRHNKRQEYIDSYSNDSSTVLEPKIRNKQDIVQQTIGTSSTLPSPLFINEAINNKMGNTNTNSLTNKSQDIDNSTDKTDKALCEIKDILQNFLQEIKKESISQIEKETSCKSEGNQSSGIKKNNAKINSSFENPSCHSDINNCSMGPFAIPSPIPPPYIPSPYLNPCCYPVLPTYPMNCLQNSFVVPPSPSFTCANCNNKMEQSHSQKKEDDIDNKPKRNTETDKLIKEIYNLVTQSPPAARKRDVQGSRSHKTIAEKKKPVVTRSVGDSVRITRHDAKVGTPKMKYYSKSCEAIGSQLDEERSANTSYSDTVLEKLSMEATETTTTETENTTTDDGGTQKKTSKLTNVLRSFGLMKKKKYVIEEEDEEDEDEESSESESSTEVQVKKKQRKKPEFPQEFANYMMFGQEHFHPPPIPPHLHQEYLAHQQGFHNLSHPFGPYPGYPIPPYHPSAPPCPCAFEGAQNPPNQKLPQAPFSLKEIEVKSTATQSERKFSFFGKFGKKKPEVTKPSPRNFSTQTAPPPAPPKPSFWERLQVPKQAPDTDPRVFSFKKQKELAAGDVKMKKAMLKKLFHKRNPFSPGNLIVRTLLGKDPSSFGEPPQMYRPRMFL